MKTSPYNEISNCLRKYRKARGLSQNEVAKIFDHKSSAMISRWEKSKNPPKILVTIIKFSVLYRTPVDALFIDLFRCCRNRVLQREETMRSRDSKAKK